MKYRRCDPFAVILAMWSCHVGLGENVTPSSRVQFSHSSCLSFIVIARCLAFVLFLSKCAIPSFYLRSMPFCC